MNMLIESNCLCAHAPVQEAAAVLNNTLYRMLFISIMYTHTKFYQDNMSIKNNVVLHMFRSINCLTKIY